MSPDRDEGGRFATQIDRDDVERALREHGEPVATARDLADALDVSTETIRRHLTESHEAGRVAKKRVGARAVVWWAIEDSEKAPAAPLQGLVGLLDDEEAAAARERSTEWRGQFNREMMDSDTDAGA